MEKFLCISSSESGIFEIRAPLLLNMVLILF